MRIEKNLTHVRIDPDDRMKASEKEAKAHPGRVEANVSNQVFDMMTVLRTPTCINYYSIMNAIKYLKPQGLRKLWVCTEPRWIEAINKWDPMIHAVDDSKALEGVSKEGIDRALYKYHNAGGTWNGRQLAGWYLMQFLNLGFVLREDVADVLLLHDADMMILPKFQVFGQGFFKAPSGASVPRFSMKVGGICNSEHYGYGHKCLTDDSLIVPTQRGCCSYVTHTWVAYRPFVKELLASFGSDGVRPHPKVGNGPLSGVAHWVENIVQCLHPQFPNLGFGESASWSTHVLINHKEAFDIQKGKSWKRNMVIGSPFVNGTCCPSDLALSFYHQWEYVGFELGHDYNSYCGYQNELYRTEPYPKTDNDFWKQRKISF